MADFTNINNVYVKDTVLRDGIQDIKDYVGYDDIYGLEFDFDAGYNVGKRLCAAKGLYSDDFDNISPWKDMKRCNLADDGTVVAYYGEQGYVEDGTAGQVMVEIPKFYYRFVPVSLQAQEQEGSADTGRFGYHIKKGWWFISPHKHFGFKTHPVFFNAAGQEVDRVYMSAYEGCIYDVSAGAYLVNDEQVGDFTAGTGDKLSSIAGVRPCSGYTQQLIVDNARTIALNRGAGWYEITIKMISAIQLLFAIEYASFNHQAILGMGVTQIPYAGGENRASFTGSTSSMGSTSGRATSTIDYTGTVQTDAGKTSVSYRGIENFHGNESQMVDGANVWGDGTIGGGSAYVASDMNFASDKKDGNYVNCGFTLPSTNAQYIKYFGYGDKQFDWLFFASKVDNTIATYDVPVGDYSYVTENINGYRGVGHGGYWSSIVFAGGHAFGSDTAANVANRIKGARLAYIG